MSMREYKNWSIGAFISCVLWLIMIFVNTLTIFSAMIGSIVGCFCFYYWIRVIPAYKNVRLSYVISVFVTLLINKIVGIQWFGAIIFSSLMMIAVMFGSLYVCTEKYYNKNNRRKYIVYRTSLLRLRRR